MPNFSRGVLLSDPNLEVVTINDFSPGIYQYGLVASSVAPLGSASSSFRCYARPGIGLCPLPSYTEIQQIGGSAVGAVTSTIGDMKVWNDTGTVSNISFTQIGYDSGTGESGFFFGVIPDSSLYGGGVGSVAYPYSVARSINIFSGYFYWPNIAKAFWADGSGGYGASAFFIDPVTSYPYTSNTWVTVPGPSAGYNTATIAGASFAFTSYSSSRGLIMCTSAAPPLITGTNLLALTFGLYTSGIETIDNPTGPNFYVPESAAGLGSWGTISTGEFVIITQQGGAIIVYGDLAYPSDVIWLPGVQGTGNCTEAGLPTSEGLIYVTDVNGVWVWDGGNTAQKISTQIGDVAVLRQRLGEEASHFPVVGQSNMAAWGTWVFFPNNWIYDTLTRSWWMAEDPAINNFQVQGGTGGPGRYFYNTIGNTSTNGGNWAIPVMRWDSTAPFSSYTWTSNLIANPGSIVNVQTVEICASNPTATDCTITVTPTSPLSQLGLGNQNPNQSVRFTIPANTAGWRGSMRLGSRAYNACVKVDASNSVGNAAPILHEISLGILPESSSAQ